MISSVADQANDDEQRQKNPLHDVTAIPTASILERRTICQENLRQIHKSMRLTRCDGGLNSADGTATRALGIQEGLVGALDFRRTGEIACYRRDRRSRAAINRNRATQRRQHNGRSQRPPDSTGWLKPTTDPNRTLRPDQHRWCRSHHARSQCSYQTAAP